MRRASWLLLALLAVGAVLAWWWWRRRNGPAGTTSVGPLDVLNWNPAALKPSAPESTTGVIAELPVPGGLGVGITEYVPYTEPPLVARSYEMNGQILYAI